MQRVLIIGAYGILAKHLILELENYEIYGLVRRIDGKRNFENVVYDTSENFITGKSNFDNFDYVINTAFTRSTDTKLIADSISTTAKIFNRLKEINVKNIINISSQSVYGMYRECAVDENGLIAPSDSYALGKYCVEEIGNATFKNSNINYTNIRLASLYGEEYKERLINKIIKKAKETNMIEIENGRQEFGFLHVEEAALGISALINAEIKKYDNVYNLGSNRDDNLNLSKIASFIKEEMNKRDYYITLNEKSSPRKTLMNSNKFFEATNWQPRTRLKEFIEEEIEQNHE